ncbi:MAG TPA: sugar-binding protein [Chthoniobacteraceae bacterium]|nr:sugar-binding protein [Chthoniobacteraceae bacterium]
MKPIVSFLLTLLFSLSAQAAPVTFEAIYTSQKPHLTGDLSDPAWENAPEYTAFINRDGSTPLASSSVRMLFDGEYLYFGARFEEPQMELHKRQFNQNDLAIFADDCLELVFDIRNRPETFHHFVVNALGAIYDSRNSDKSWSSYHSTAKGSVTKDGWSVELAIPFADLGVPTPVFGERWSVRLGRERKPVAENSSLPPTRKGLFARQDLAPLVFRNDPKATSPITVEAPGEDRLRWGVNQVPLRLKNESAQASRSTLTAKALSHEGETVETWTQTVDLPAGRTSEIAMEIPITSDAVENIALVLSDENGKPVWGHLLPFAQTTPRLHEIEARLPLLRADLLLTSTSRQPLYKTLSKPVADFAAALGKFRSDLATAIQKKQTLADTEVATLQGEAEKFHQWLLPRDLVVWQVNPWKESTPDDLPPSLPDAPPTLHFTQAGNEREAVAIQLAGLLPAGRLDLRLAVSDLKRKDDADVLLSRDHLQVFHSPRVRNGMGHLIHDPLIRSENNAFTVTAGQAERLWIVFDSRGVAPGEYEGEITLKPVDTDRTERSSWKKLPIKVTVLDFTLPETPDWPLDTFLFGPGITPSDEMEFLKLFDRYHINWMMTNRFAYMWRPRNDGTLWDKDPEKKIPQQLYYDPERLRSQDSFLREAKRRGMKLIFGWNATRNLQWYAEMIPHLRDEIGFRYEEFAFQGVSDEFLAAGIPKHIGFHREIHRQDPRIRFMATLTSVPPPAGATFEELDELAPYIDLWIHHQPRLWPPDAERTRENLAWFRHRKRTIWSYTCATQMQNWPVEGYYRLAPWRGYLAGVDGIALWTAMSPKGDSFDHGDGYDEGILFRGNDKVPVTTRRMEALREGLEDVAYMALLKTTLARLREAQPQRSFEAEERLLSETPLAIEKDPQNDAILERRRQILSTLQRLLKP